MTKVWFDVIEARIAVTESGYDVRGAEADVKGSKRRNRKSIHINRNFGEENGPGEEL